jgi:MFS family permease
MAVAYIRTLRTLGRDVRLYLTGAAAYGFAQEGVRGVLLNLYLLRLGYGPRFIGLVSAASLLAFTAACPAAGALATRKGSRTVMITGMGLITVGSGLLPLVESLPTAWESGLLLATAALTGLGMALYLVNGIPFLMGATQPQERDHAFSAQMGLVPLAAFAGSLVGGALPGVLTRMMGVPADSPAPYRYALLLAATLLVPALLTLLVTEPRTVWPRPAQETAPVTSDGSPGTAVRDAAPWGIIGLIALVAGLRFAGQSTTRTFFNVYLDDELGAPTALIGTITAAAQLVAVPAALATPMLVARWSRRQVIIAGSLGQALSQSVLAMLPRPGAAGLGYAGTMALFQTTTSAFRVFSQELASLRWRATMAAALMMGAGFTASIMTFFGGFVITVMGYRNLFFLGAGLTALGAGVFALFSRGKDAFDGQDATAVGGQNDHKH